MTYQSETIGALAGALAKAQGEFTFAAKSSTAPVFDKGGRGGTRTYADLASVLDAVRAPLSKNGLSVVQLPMQSDKDGIVLRTTLLHESGEWMASELYLPADRMGGVHGMGSALTYARRYALAAMVGIAQDDDDGEESVRHSKKAEADRVQQTRRHAEADNPNRPTPEQLKALMAVLSKRHGDNREAYQQDLSSFFGREIKTSKELTKTDIIEYIDAVNSTKEGE